VTRNRRGSSLVCAELASLGVRTVFALPGTQNVELFEALRGSGLRTVVPASELGGALMACGYARASGEPGLLLTIPGPGFTFALPGLAEARLDSIPLVHLTGTPAERPGSAFQLQAIDQAATAAPLTKAALRADRPGEVAPALRRAIAEATGGEPGPVLVELSPAAICGRARPPAPARQSLPAVRDEDVETLVAELGRARRVLVYAGQGASGGSEALRELVERLGAPVLATTSARGVLAEDHPLSLPFDPVGGGLDVVNALVGRCDLVLALGCKLGHNGAAGFKLRLPPERLMHVDASPDVLGRNYPARLSLTADVPALLAALTSSPLGSRPGWPDEEVAKARAALLRARRTAGSDPALPELEPGGVEAFFAALRERLPRDACLVTDSGLHQYLARRHFAVLGPRGLVTPADFQAMGFGIPAAVGAAVAEPRRRVVALVGDGGLAVSAAELATAAREGVRLTVIVFVDGRYGLIRLQQLGATGTSFGVELPPLDYPALCAALSIAHVRLSGPLSAALDGALDHPGVTLLEVRVDDDVAARAARRRGKAKALRDRALSRLKRAPKG